MWQDVAPAGAADAGSANRAGLTLGAVHAGPEVEADLLGGPCACAAAGAIGLTLDMPQGGDPAMCGGAPARLAPVWEGEQVAESPYQRFMQVRACSGPQQRRSPPQSCLQRSRLPLHAPEPPGCSVHTVHWSYDACMIALCQR